MISRINIEKSNKMPAVITDQFRILNASNFVDTVTGVGGLVQQIHFMLH